MFSLTTISLYFFTKQREQWFTTGYTTGSVEAYDTVTYFTASFSYRKKRLIAQRASGGIV